MGVSLTYDNLETPIEEIVERAIAAANVVKVHH
jgi:hypothetical protein